MNNSANNWSNPSLYRSFIKGNCGHLKTEYSSPIINFFWSLPPTLMCTPSIPGGGGLFHVIDSNQDFIWNLHIENWILRDLKF